MRKQLGTLGHSFIRSFRQARRTPALAFGFPAVASIAMVGVFGQLVKRIGDLPAFPTASYVDWLAAGAVTMIPMTGAIFSGMALATDIRTGYIDRLRLLPISTTAFLTGRVLFDGVRVLPATGIVLIVANALGANLLGGIAGIPLVLVMVGVWSVAYNSLFLLIAARTRSPEVVQAFFPIFAPLTFLSSVWFPRPLMPAWAETAAGMNPVTRIADGVRAQLTLGSDGSKVIVALAVASGLAAAFQVLATRSIQTSMQGA